MRFINYLNEEYAFRFHPRGRDTEVFINPTADDFKELFKNTDTLRFAVSYKDRPENFKNMYVVDATKAIHQDLVDGIPEAYISVLGEISIPTHLINQQDYTKRVIIYTSIVNCINNHIEYPLDLKPEMKRRFFVWVKSKFNLRSI